MVVKDLTKSYKKRLCIDFSQTVNLYTELDAEVHRISFSMSFSKYTTYKKFIYKMYTAFEANGKLFQFF